MRIFLLEPLKVKKIGFFHVEICLAYIFRVFLPGPLERNFSFLVDEPEQLLGENAYPTPQEYLLGGMGACMIVGYSVGASVMGITLEKLEIDIEAGLNLRGFLEVDPEAPIGFKDVKYTIRVKGNGTREQFEQIHQKVIDYSPNRANISNAITVVPDLFIEE